MLKLLVSGDFFVKGPYLRHFKPYLGCFLKKTDIAPGYSDLGYIRRNSTVVMTNFSAFCMYVSLYTEKETIFLDTVFCKCFSKCLVMFQKNLFPVSDSGNGLDLHFGP